MKKSEIPLDKIEVVLYPELIASAMKRGEGELYVCWSVLKAIDAIKGGRGIYRSSNIKALICTLLGVGARRSHQLMAKGQSRYWQGSGYMMGLRSRRNVISELAPTMGRVEPFVFKVRDFQSEGHRNTDSIRGLLVSIIAARFVDFRPISIDSIADQVGMSPRTVQRHLGHCPHLRVHKNFEAVAKHRHEIKSDYLYKKYNVGGSRPFLITKTDSATWVLKQLPNTYVLSEPRRLNLGKRPSDLKMLDAQNAADCSPRRYWSTERREKAAINGIVLNGYAQIGEANLVGHGKVRLWRLPSRRQVDDIEKR